MQDFDYKTTYSLCRKFWELGAVEVMVLDALFPHTTRIMSYSDLANEIGKDVSNTRKAALNLESMGIIFIGKNVGLNSTKKRCFFIIDGWMRTLVNTKTITKKHSRKSD